MSLDDPTREQIESLIQSNDVVLFMKGDRQTPQCGFSATLIQILESLTSDYATADVLSDPALREGIKIYSSWPTIPQLYVKGEFIGGCDIIQELYSSGELHEKLGIQLDLEARPQITISDEDDPELYKSTSGRMGGYAFRLRPGEKIWIRNFRHKVLQAAEKEDEKGDDKK